MGAFVVDVPLSFPDDQALVEGGRATCEFRHATESIDSPLSFTLQFGRPDRRPLDTEVRWALPEPSLRPSQVIAPPGDINTPARLGNDVAYRPGVLGASQFVRVGIVDRPATPTRYLSHACTLPPNTSSAWNWEYCQLSLRRPDTLFRAHLLPVAITVSSGRKQATTGSSVFVNLPGKYADQVTGGGTVEGYARVPLRYTSDSAAYVPVRTLYNESLQLLKVDLIDFNYDDERSPHHEYEALVLLMVRPPVGEGPRR